MTSLAESGTETAAHQQAIVESAQQSNGRRQDSQMSRRMG